MHKQSGSRGGGGSSHNTAPITVSVSPPTADVVTSSIRQFTATVTGTSTTAVNWSVAGVAGGNSTVGTISSTGLYTAPASIPNSATVSVTAVAQADSAASASAVVTIVKPAINQQAQSFPIKLGTTGGNVKDFNIQGNTITCCSGTLGSLVSRGGAQFILSNNHILARSDQASPDEAISQPGLVDNNCNPGATVANLTQAAPLKTAPDSVDAAIAAVASGAVDPSGAILGLGTPNSQAAPPANTIVAATIGMSVAKSGRSTALTCSSVQTINTTVSIDYQKGCGTGTTFTITYSNQVVVNGGSFSASGDSGSLIVNSQTAQPVALLYGGNTTNTVGNPIQDVLTALKDPATGAVPSVVGGVQHAIACPASGATQATKLTVSETEAQRATAAKTKHEPALMADPAVIGVGVGASEDSPGQAAIEIYVDKQKTHVPIPATIDGVRTKIIVTDRFHATENNTVSSEPTRAGTTQAEESLPESEVARATAVKEKHMVRLMSDSAIIGVGIGRSADDHSSAALVIYVDESRPVGAISARIDDVRTRVIRTDRFRAYTAGGEQTPNPRAWVGK